MNAFSKTNLFLAAGLLFLGGCSNEQPVAGTDAKTVRLTADFMRPAIGDKSRTELSENAEGSLDCVWSDGDRILVTRQDGSPVGELTLISDYAGKQNGKFDGTITGVNDGETTLRFIYLGKKDRAIENGNALYDLSVQDGTVASFGENDCLSSDGNVSVAGGSAYIEDMGLKRHIAFGRFKFVFQEDINAEGSVVTVGGENLGAKASFSFSDSKLSLTAEPVKVTVGKDNEFYMTILPCNGISPEFSVTVGEKSYVGKLDARDWKANEYVRAEIGNGQFSGIEINMQPVVPETPADDDTVGPVFDINGKKYKFTSGNLWYNTTTETWGIFDNQAYFYNAGGLGYKNTKADTPELIGLFAWGATGLEDAQKPWFLKGESYTANHGGAYWPSTAGSSKNSTIKNLWENEYVYDWGRAYMESGRAAYDDRQYITPSINEFKTLMTNCFVQGATIKGAGINGEDITGLLCIPGKYTIDQAKDFIRSVEGATCLSSMVAVIHNNAGNTLSYKNITLNNIEVLKKLNDAIFFPAASKRNLSSGKVYNSDGLGWYWSANGGTTNATNLFFNGKDGGFFYNGSSQSNMGRNNQMAVRLLVEVKE